MQGLRGILDVQPQYAQLTKDTDFFGKMDPYCVIKVGTKRQVTAVHKNGGKNPTWLDKLKIKIEGEDLLKVEVWDKDSATSNDLIGEGQLILSYQAIGQGGIKMVPLTYKGKNSGNISLNLQFFPDGGQQFGMQQGMQPQQFNQSFQPQMVAQQFPQQQMQYPQQQVPVQQQFPVQQQQFPQQFPPQQQQYGQINPQFGQYMANQMMSQGGYQGIPQQQQGYPLQQGFPQQGLPQQQYPQQQFPQQGFQQQPLYPPMGQQMQQQQFGGIYGGWKISKNVDKSYLKMQAYELFKYHDRDNSGYLDEMEFQTAVIDLFRRLNMPPPPPQLIYDTMDEYGFRGILRLSFKEFKYIITELCGCCDKNKRAAKKQQKKVDWSFLGF